MPLSRHRELIAGLQRLKAQKVQAQEIMHLIQRFDAENPQHLEPLGCSAATISQLRNNKLRLSKGKEERWIACIKQIFIQKKWNYTELVTENPIDAPENNSTQADDEPTENAKKLPLPTEYTGVFVGYYIDVNDKMLCEAVFLVAESGKTIGKSAQGYTYEGRFDLNFGSHLLIGSFMGANAQSSHRFSITYSTTSFRQNGFLDGAYSGKGERFDDPMGGRTRMYKEADYDSSAYALYEEREPAMFNLRYPNVLRDFRHTMHERIRDVLLLCMGKTEMSYQIGESLRFFEDIGMIPPVIDTQISRLKGSYATFKTGTDGKIFCNMMRIFSRGYVEIKSAENQNVCFMGRAYLNGSILHIFFFKKYFPPSAHGIPENFEPYYAYYNYKLGLSIERRENINHIFGISAHVTENAGLRAGYEILMPLAEDAEGEAYETTASFKIDALRCSEAEKDNYLDQYPALAYVFEQQRKAFIVEERTINSTTKPFAANEKGNTYFAAACYHFYNNNYETGLKYAEQAKIAGFKEHGRLLRELQTGLLAGLAKQDKQSILDIFGLIV
jgi:hypothetical protein